MTFFNIGWNGSLLTFNAVAAAPLTDLHQPNDPADFDTTGSADTAHTHGTGLPKNSFTASFLGSLTSQIDAGAIVSIGSSISGGTSAGPTTASYAAAMISQISVSGRKDGRIEGNLTAMPGVPSLTPLTYSNTIGNLGFNGSTFGFASIAFNGLLSASYTASATPIEASGSGETDNLYTPGIPDQSITITTLGGPQCAAKAKGATVMVWADNTGAPGLGSSATAGGVTAECVSVHPGGSLDGQTTTEHVFKMRRSGAGSD